MTPTSSQSLSKSLLSEYALLMHDAVLRNDILRLEEASRLKIELARRFKDNVLSNVSENSDVPLTVLVEFSGWLKGQCTSELRPQDIEQYARLVEMAATKLLATVERILNEPIPDAAPLIIEHEPAAANAS